MYCTFVETALYKKIVDSLKDSDVVKKFVESVLLENPKQGDLVPGTGGLRKMRVPGSGKGKRGGYRVVYYHHVSDEEIYLIHIYDKSTSEDLSEDEKKIIKELIKTIKKS